MAMLTENGSGGGEGGMTFCLVYATCTAEIHKGADPSEQEGFLQLPKG